MWYERHVSHNEIETLALHSLGIQILLLHMFGERERFQAIV